MQVIQKRISGLRKRDVINVVLFSCTHFGQPGLAKGELAREVEKTKETPHTHWLHLGDAGEFISKNDSRWEMDALDPEYKRNDFIDLQVERSISTFNPIRRQSLGFIMGNHEDTYLRHTNSNPGTRISGGLDIPFLGYTALIRLQMAMKSGREWNQVIFAAHGHGTSARTLPGQMAYLKRIADGFAYDVAVMGHVHRRAVDNNEIKLTVNDEGNDVEASQRIFVIAGSFFKTYFVREDGSAGYGEKKHYPPSALGCSSVEFHVGEQVTRGKDYWA